MAPRLTVDVISLYTPVGADPCRWQDVRSEPNNRLYFLHEDRNAPGHFVFYEIFASQADFEAHNATSHVKRWFAQLPELAEGDVSVVRLKILGNEGGLQP